MSCELCGEVPVGPNHYTEEHAPPRWVTQMLPDHSSVSSIRFGPDSPFFPTAYFRKSTIDQPNPFNRVLGKVCYSCNHGRLRQLELVVEPEVRRLYAGDEPTESVLAVLGAWVLKTAYLIPIRNGGRPVPREHAWFAVTERRPPPGCTLYLTRLSKRTGQFQHAIKLGTSVSSLGSSSVEDIIVNLQCYRAFFWFGDLLVGLNFIPPQSGLSSALVEGLHVPVWSDCATHVHSDFSGVRLPEENPMLAACAALGISRGEWRNEIDPVRRQRRHVDAFFQTYRTDIALAQEDEARRAQKYARLVSPSDGTRTGKKKRRR